MGDKNNNFYFVLTFLAIVLAGALLFKIYNDKKTYSSLQKEFDDYKAEQEGNQEWSVANYLFFSFKYPRDWHVSIFFPNDDHNSKTYAISPYPIDFTRVAFSRGIYELTIYEDSDLYNDQFWQAQQDEYLKELEFIEPDEFDTDYGHVNYYRAKEGQDTAPGQNVEAYFYKFSYTITDADGNQESKTIYLKLELLYINDLKISQMMKEIVLSIKPL